ncbi:unnamed protein product [Hydatigera taeniaeformis]|uniref:Pecanex-like protein n=1 Tax=Hydatigena taeniaeformis TaxID=6205 RepID=A0A0R3X7V5_HYDTA|nr:unnamed protein product [Hydatigera taeniaeformis]
MSVPLTTARTLLRRLSLLPETDSGGPHLPSLSSSQNSPTEGAGLASTTIGGSSDTSSALVHACFTGLGLVHFAVAFWTRAWLFRLVLLFASVGLLVYAVASLQLVSGALWLLRQVWISLTTALRSSDFFTTIENGEYSLLLIPPSLRLSLRWARKIERYLYDFIDEYLDYLVSFVIISLMVLISLLFAVFLVVQVSVLPPILNSSIH